MKNENYIVNEINCLVSEKADILKQTINTERYSVVLTGVIWVWLLTSGTKIESSVLGFVAWTPLFISILGALRNFGLAKRKQKIDQYILNVEKHISKNFIHWIQFKQLNKTKVTFVKASAFIFWVVLVASNVVCLVVY